VFTGLVQDVATAERVEPREDAVELVLAPDEIDAGDLAIGESIAVDGVCLTVTEREERRFRVLAGAETLRRTTLGALAAGGRVNLERALRAGDRLGGHVVSGHVDGVAEIGARRALGANLELEFRPPAPLLRYLVEKGSVAVDGISLTVNRVGDTSFEVALIPHTVERTALAAKKVGDKVNLEVDMIAKYVEKLVQGYSK
jgi:riboflavin synthase